MEITVVEIVKDGEFFRATVICDKAVFEGTGRKPERALAFALQNVAAYLLGRYGVGVP